MDSTIEATPGELHQGGFSLVPRLTVGVNAPPVYCLRPSSLRSHALVFNLGGSTLSLTLILVAGGMYRTLLSHTHSSLGGQLLNSPLVELMAGEFQRQWKEDVRERQRALGKLRIAAESAKHTLSTDQTASVHVDSLHDGIDFQYKLTR